MRILVNDSWSAVTELEEFGVKLSLEGKKVSIVGDKHPTGIFLTKTLSKYVLDLGVKVLEDTFVFDLVIEDGRCIGALAFKKNENRVLAISAKATVIATGGYSGLYVRNDNPPSIIGDGIALAFKSGAEIQDLEFVQFLPMFIDPEVPRIPMVDWLTETVKNLVPGGPLVNDKGERFLKKYGLIKRKILRDNLIVAIEKEIYDERVDYVYLDLTSLSSNEIESAFNFEYQKRIVRPFTQILSSRKLRVASFAHYTMGGIRIDENCETKIKGLFAVGEVVGGIHGANRVGGNALTDIVVFGRIAGMNAASYSESISLKAIDEAEIKEGLSFLNEIRKEKGANKVSPSTLKESVKSIISRFCRPVISGEGLKLALAELKRVEEKSPLLYGSSPQELEEAIEAKFMMLLAKLVLISALEREESRGSHFRVDFPERDDKNWLKNVVISRNKGGLNVRRLPVLDF